MKFTDIFVPFGMNSKNCITSFHQHQIENTLVSGQIPADDDDIPIICPTLCFLILILHDKEKSKANVAAIC